MDSPFRFKDLYPALLFVAALLLWGSVDQHVPSAAAPAPATAQASEPSAHFASVLRCEIPAEPEDAPRRKPAGLSGTGSTRMRDFAAAERTPAPGAAVL
jgi:hypothetical protein